MYPTKKLGEICEIITWSTPKTSNLDFFWWDILWAWPADIWEEKYIFKTNKTLTDKWLFDGKARLVKKWSVLLVAIGTIWKVSIAGSDLTTNQQIHALQTEKNIIPEFLYYCLLSNKEKLKNQASSAVLAILNKSRLSNFLIPPLSTQKLIVEKLDMIFVEIEKSKNLLQKNLQNVDEMNKSVLEKIFSNEEWERKKLWEVCEVIWWWTPKTEISEYWWEDIIWLSPTDLPEVWEITKISNSTKKISILWLQNSSAKLLPVWSVIFSSRATIGKIAINDIELSTNQGFTNFVCSGWVYNYFLAYALKNFTKDIIALSNSTTFKEVNKTNLRNFSIPLPPLETQKNIVSYLDNIFAENQKLKNLYQAQIKNLDEMKQSFLKKAFAGELV